ncbi:stonustoxin subunit beta-like [Pempheris klunzingeri]|uniref:stonustoxin subunit beta-like n=1 Tax=Pempheris klunzingeri TaxID=3127111 RepID=UPI003980A6BC
MDRCDYTNGGVRPSRTPLRGVSDGGTRAPSGQHGGEQRPELMKYACELKPDTNTICANLKLCNDDRMVAVAGEQQPCCEQPERFENWPQLLCTDGVTGRCYWEVEFSGNVHVAVTYGGIGRRGDGDDCVFGENDQSWSLRCSEACGYSVWHNKTNTVIPSSSPSSSSSGSNRVAVFVDYPAGTLSFFRVCSDKLIHLHTFNTTFTEPLYPGFGFWLWPSSSVSLCAL